MQWDQWVGPRWPPRSADCAHAACKAASSMHARCCSVPCARCEKPGQAVALFLDALVTSEPVKCACPGLWATLEHGERVSHPGVRRMHAWSEQHHAHVHAWMGQVELYSPAASAYAWRGVFAAGPQRASTPRRARTRGGQAHPPSRCTVPSASWQGGCTQASR